MIKTDTLAINEALGKHPAMAKTLANMGLLSTAAGNPSAALRYAVRACAPFDEFPNRHSTAPLDLARLWRSLGKDTVGAAWQEITGKALSAEIAVALDQFADAMAKQENDS